MSTTTQHAVRLELVDDVVLSRRNATAGEHESLSHLPGSALRGWAASRLYEALGAQAWAVFHAGAVRFGDAWPLLDDGQPALPMPLALHGAKGEGAGDGVWNLAHPQGRDMLPPGVQPQQLRAGFVSEGGVRLRPRLARRMMTAIDDDGLAAESRLYGYESLAAGQCFEARLDFEAAVPAAVVERVLACFEGTLRLGRSRATSYGRVRASLRPAPASPQRPAAGTPELTLWLLADAQLRGADGGPRLEPGGQALGVPGAELVRERSFVRTRRYSAWNAHRAAHEIERQVLAAGSVLVLHKPGGFSAEEIARLGAGIGIERGSGLGAVRLAPALLQQPTARLQPGEPLAPVPDRAQATALATPLARWLQGRAAALGQADAAQAWVDQTLPTLREFVRRARLRSSIAPGQPFGPGRAQWGLVGGCARRASTLDGLLAALDLAVPADDRDWKIEAMDRGGVTGSLRDWLMKTARSLAATPGLLHDGDRLDAWERLVDAARSEDLQAGPGTRAACRAEEN